MSRLIKKKEIWVDNISKQREERTQDGTDLKGKSILWITLHQHIKDVNRNTLHSGKYKLLKLI